MNTKNNRYERQILLPEIGREGQIRLGSSSVLVVGAGGLGAPVLQYLAAAGVGRIGIVDGDTVSINNLNRQVLYGMGDVGAADGAGGGAVDGAGVDAVDGAGDIGGAEMEGAGRKKAALAAKRLTYINDEIEVAPYPVMLTPENAHTIISKYDALALCVDSITARITVNRSCVAANIPFVDGAVSRFQGTVMTVIPGETPCYECIHVHSVQAEGPVPILGAMAGWVGCAQALAVIRLLLGADDRSRGAILFFDGIEMSVDRLAVAKNLRCACCGDKQK